MKTRDRFFSWLEALIAAWKFRGFAYMGGLLEPAFILRFFRSQQGGGELTIFGMRFRYLRFDSAKHLLQEMFGANVYFFPCANASPVILDIGANIGDSVLYFKHLYPNSRILAFEPNPNALALLRENVALNRLAGIEIFPYALGEHEGEMDLYDEGGGSFIFGSGSRDYVRQFTAGNAPISTKVPLRRASQVPEIAALGRIDLLKIDIEGAELSVLRDMAPLLGKVDRLIFEYHFLPGSGNSFDEIAGILKHAGFVLMVSGTYLSIDGLASPHVFYVTASQQENGNGGN